MKLEGLIEMAIKLDAVIAQQRSQFLFYPSFSAFTEHEEVWNPKFSKLQWKLSMTMERWYCQTNISMSNYSMHQVFGSMEIRLGRIIGRLVWF